jgi:hypothetical protein
VLWPNADFLKEGEGEVRSCAELGPVEWPSERWTLRCVQGQLVTEIDNCRGSGDASLRKLASSVAPCVPAPTVCGLGKDRHLAPCDEWWPGICAALANQTQTTLAGASGNGSSLMQLNEPGGLVVDFIGNIIIADTINERVQMWQSLAWANGLPGQTIVGISDTSGTWDDTYLLNSPSDVVLSGCRDMYVADTDNHRVTVKRPGYSMMIVGVGESTSVSGNLELNSPRGVFVTKNETIYIADTGNHRVMRFYQVPPHGHWVYDKVDVGVTGTPGSSLDMLNSPSDVFLDLMDNVYVADTGNNRILKIPKGASIGYVVGETDDDSNTTQCLSPTSVHVDTGKNVFAVCQASNCVLRWDWDATSGSYGPAVVAAGICGDPIEAPLLTDPSYGESLTRLNSPTGVFVDGFGSVLVTDSGNQRVISVGSDPLSQWVVRNSELVVTNFHFNLLEFYTDLLCTQLAPVTGFMSDSSLDGVANLSSWSASCQGGCDSGVKWLGNNFGVPTGIKCLRVKLAHTTPGGMALTVQYWTGLAFKNWYEFGFLLSGVNHSLRLPRFDTYVSHCIKGGTECILSGVDGDWHNDNDKIMMKTIDCSTGQVAEGFPNGGISDPATSLGSSFRLGVTGESVWIAADAHSGTNYVICWCDSQLPAIVDGCTVPGDFTFFMGTVIVEGPFNDQTFVTWRGQQVTITLTGVLLAANDVISAISGACGPSAQAVVGLMKVDGSFSSSLSSADGNVYSWPQTDYALATPGSYPLCWCRPTAPPALGCNSVTDFRGVSGTLIVNGPNTGQNFVCIRGYPCTLSLIGLAIDLGDSLDLQENTCGENEYEVSGFPQKYAYNSDVPRTFSWGETNVQSLVGLYYVCWCSVTTNCTIAEEYRAEVGILAMYGPELRTLTCILGRECTAIQVTGVGLGNGDRLLISKGVFDSDGNVVYGGSSWTQCTVDQEALPGFPGEYTGITYAGTANGRTYVWGVVQSDLVKAAQYQICWCYRNSGAGCTTPAGFVTEMGTLVMRGPYLLPSGESFVCGAGKTCTLSIFGLQLNDQDRMIVVTLDESQARKGCGSSGSLAVEGLTVANALSVATLIGTQHRWNSYQVPYGGEASVCWCGENCLTLGDFGVMVGKLAITAPAQGVNRTCYSGLTCIIRLTGIGLQETNKMSMFNGPCATGEFAVGVPNSATSANTTAIGNFKNVTDFLFGSSELAIRSTGAIYSACWCSDGCTLKAEFIITVGYIYVVAPFGDHVYTCWRGITCNVSDVSGIGLSTDNFMQIAPLCGEPVTEGGLPNNGKSVATLLNGTAYSFGSSKVLAQPQVFELCWCSGLYACDDGGEFVTKAGVLTVGGPYAGQMRQCYVGQECDLPDIKGLALRRLDKVIFLQTWCGAGSFIEGSPADTWQAVGCQSTEVIPEAQLSQAQKEEDLSCAKFLVPKATPVYKVAINPQMYRMCWCSVINVECKNTEDFLIDVGIITVSGPTQDQQFFCVPGFICNWKNLLGVSLAVNDRWLLRTGVSKICTAPPMTDGVPDGGMSLGAVSKGKEVEWSIPFSQYSPPGKYTVCWCPSALQCTKIDDEKMPILDMFNAYAGTLTILGTRQIPIRTCAVGSICIIAGITGEELQNGDRIIVLNAPDGGCGSAEAKVIEGFPNAGVSNPATVYGSTYGWPMLPTSLPGGTYVLCWCPYSRADELDFLQCLQSNGTHMLPVLSDYRVQVGMLTIPGTPVSDLTPECTSGLPCTVDGVKGVGGAPLVNGAQILVRKPVVSPIPQDFCRDAAAGIPAEGFPNGAVSDGAKNDGEYYEWAGDVVAGGSRITALGGFYRLCWRAPPPPYDFNFPVGTLRVVGPAGNYVETCTMKRICILEGINGIDMSQDDSVMVLPVGCDPEAGAVAMPMKKMFSATEVRWEAFEVEARAGKYSVCWCFRDTTCKDPKDFSIQLGELTVRGTNAGQNRNCDRGLDCLVEDISGFSLKAGDKAEAHVECGPGPRVVGFTIDAGNKGSPTTTGSPMGTTGFQASLFKFKWYDLRAIPGIFRICWCASWSCPGDGPFVTENFGVEVGIITVQGPADLTEATMIPETPLWGRDWKIILKGLRLYLAEDGRIRMLDRCGLCNTGGVNATNIQNLNETPVAVNVPNTLGAEWLFSATNMTLLNPDREYCVCWCLRDCDTLDNFKLDLGRVAAFCAAGQEPVPWDGRDLSGGPKVKPIGCEACSIGRYKQTATNDGCLTCSDQENHITREPGATNAKQCYCKPGMFSDPEGGICQSCPDNSYCEGGFSYPGCMEHNFCPDECAGEKANEDKTDRVYLCAALDNCMFNYKALCTHTQPAGCPYGSGSVNREVCPDTQCTGPYPAWNVSSCSCEEGYEPVGDRCLKCNVGFKKEMKGNASCSECNKELSGSTTQGIGQTECACGPTRYMEYDAASKPLLCSFCATGFYCVGYTDRAPCADNKTTQSGTPAKSPDECVCAPGFTKDLEREGYCQPCTQGDIFYKSDLGDDPCSEPCPLHSKIPADYVGGARAPESCLCDDGFVSDVDESTGRVFCVNYTGIMIFKNQTRVPSVNSFVILEIVKPQDVYDDIDKIRKFFASQLGLENAEKVMVKIDSFIMPEINESRRLLELHTRRLNASCNTSGNCSNVSVPVVVKAPEMKDLVIGIPATSVTVEVTIWQSTYREATDIYKDRMNPTTTGNTTLDAIKTVLNLDDAFEGVENVTFNTTITPPRLAYISLECEEHTGIIDGTIFESKQQSCQCLPGYEPAQMLIDNGLQIPEGWSPDLKCSPCQSDAHSSKSQGRYKEDIGDFFCSYCDFPTGPDVYLPSGDSEPRYGSSYPLQAAFLESQCACPKGQYRTPGTHGCRSCEPGHYCPGDNTLMQCVVDKPSTWTKETSFEAFDNESCHCERGWFRAQETQLCTMCDPGYYKSDIDNGEGRCTQRCSFEYGFRSTSQVAATSLFDCYCQPQSFLNNKTTQCEACPVAGVECLGGFVNETGADNSTNRGPRKHMLPTSTEGFWMIDAQQGVATQCRTDGVCQPENVCLEGQKGFICGTCEALWTRDNFQTVCRSCLNMPDTFALIVQILTDLTVATFFNMFLTASAVSKSEAQKNILTVLLRMYTHWSSQVMVLNNYNLSALSPMYSDSEGGEAQIDPLEEITENTTNETAAATGLPWPAWQGEIMEDLMLIKGAVPTVGSTQEVMECLIDLHMPESAAQKYWKLVAPAMYWLLFPAIMTCWVIMWAFLISRLGVGGYLVASGDKSLFAAMGFSEATQKRLERLFHSKKKKKDKNTGEEISSSESSDDVFSDDSDDDEEIRLARKGDVDVKMADKSAAGRANKYVKKKKNEPGLKDWTNLAVVMNHLVILPRRFSRFKKVRTKAQEAQAAAAMDDDAGEVTRILVFFKPDTTFKELVTDDIAPWIVVSLNNVWVITTNRLLQMLYCENFPLGEIRLMMSTEVTCWESMVHNHLTIIGITGLWIWSVGIVSGLYYIIRRAETAGELQGAFIQRTFGYLLEGYEPRCWHWELLWNKMDLLATAVITYTSLASDTRAKVLLYAVLASVAITLQISYQPYDNRNVNLLDHVEMFGLTVRFLVFWGVAFCLLFDTSATETMIVAGVVLTFSMLFLLQLGLYASDDWVTSQFNNFNIKVALLKNELKKKKAKAEAEEVQLAAAQAQADKEAARMAKGADPKKAPAKKKVKKPPKNYQKIAFELLHTFLKYARQNIFATDFRATQLVRFHWRGPTNDAFLYAPKPTEGRIAEEDMHKMGQARVIFEEKKGNQIKWVWGLDTNEQTGFAKDCIADFAYMLIVMAKFKELPARLTDIMMLLASSIKALRWDMMNNPQVKTKKKKKKVDTAPPPKDITKGCIIQKDGRKGKILQMNPYKVKWMDNDMIEDIKGWKGVKVRKDLAGTNPNNPNAKDNPNPVAEAPNAAKKENEEVAVPDVPDIQDDDSDQEDRGPMQQLKAMLLRDIFQRLMAESKARDKLLVLLKPQLEPMLRERLIPQELAWEILDRMTTGQIRAALVNPGQVLLKVRFFMHLLQCGADSDAALNRIAERNEQEDADREHVMKFIEFALRSGMENRSMHWDEAAEILNTLPTEELKHYGNDHEKCFEMLEKTYSHAESKDLKAEADKEMQAEDAVTVEDLNNMLMFLQKFTYDELHEVLEYAQLLLDFLQLPANDVWRGRAAREEAMENDIKDDQPTYKQALKQFQDKVDLGKEDEDENILRGLTENAPLVDDAPMEATMAARYPEDGLLGENLDAAGASGSPNASDESGGLVVQGRYVNGNGNGYANGNGYGLPPVAEDRYAAFPPPARRRHPGDPPTKPSQRPAAGRIHSSAGGVGLTHARMQPDEDEPDDGSTDDDWDEDDDDPTVSIDFSGSGGVNLEDISLDDRASMRSSAQSWQSLHFDDDAVSNGGRSASAMSAHSDISELTGFSNVPSVHSSMFGNGYGNGNGSWRGSRPGSVAGDQRGPSMSGARVAPRPSQSPPDTSSNEKSRSRSDSGSTLPGEGAAQTTRHTARGTFNNLLRSSRPKGEGDKSSSSGSQKSVKSHTSQKSEAAKSDSIASESKKKEIERMKALLEEEDD